MTNTSIPSGGEDEVPQATLGGGVELLPCPFCGGEAEYKPDHTVENTDHVQCAGKFCVNISDPDGQGSCIEAWNTRAEPSAQATNKTPKRR